MTSAAPKHLELNLLLERTWHSLCHNKNTLIVHVLVDDTCIHFALKTATDIFSVIPIRTLRKEGKLTTSYELFYGKKPKLKKFRVLFCPCVAKKYTATLKNEDGCYINVDVNKRFVQKGVWRMHVGFDEFTTAYLIFIPHVRQIVTSVDVTFDESFYASLAYKYQTHREVLLTRPVHEIILYEYTTKKTGDITDMYVPHIGENEIAIVKGNDPPILDPVSYYDSDSSKIPHVSDNLHDFTTLKQHTAT